MTFQCCIVCHQLVTNVRVLLSVHIIYKLHNVITIYILLYTLVKYKVTYCTLSSIFYSFFTPFFAPPPASHRPFQLLYCKFVCSWNHRRGHTPFALNLWPTHTIAAFVKKFLRFLVRFFLLKYRLTIIL